MGKRTKRTKFEAGANDRARHPVKTLAINALRQNTSALEIGSLGRKRFD
jgi:hypothetical protein